MTSSRLEAGSALGRSPLQVTRLGSFRAVVTKSLYVTWHRNDNNCSDTSQCLLRDMKELVVLLLLPNRFVPREEHLDVLLEVPVLEELAVVL